MPIVYSTLACDNVYAQHVQSTKDLHHFEHKILIKGGAGVANKHLITPKGVATIVTDEQLEALEKNPGFAQHKKNGFITVQKSGNEAVDKAVKNMKADDESKPLTDADFEDLVEEEKSKQPVINIGKKSNRK